jgi:hypothetical protein
MNYRAPAIRAEFGKVKNDPGLAGFHPMAGTGLSSHAQAMKPKKF